MSQEVGHGRPGLRSGIRIFDDVQKESARRKDAYSRIEGGAIINSTWFNAGSGVFAFTWNQTFDNVVLDVVGVRTIGATLTRVDTQAELIAGSNVYVYAKDPGGILQLGVHLAGGANPSGVNVLVLTAFYDSTGGLRREHLVHPELGREKFANADLSLWAGSPVQPSSWTVVTTFNWQVSQDAPILDDDIYSVKIEGLGPSGSGRIRQAPSTVSGTFCRWFGYYRTPKDMPSTAGARVRIGTTVSLTADGRTPDATLLDSLDLQRTAGKTRAYVFDYISHETSPNLELIVYNTAASNCHAWFGRTSQKKVHCWNRYGPTIAPDGLPECFEGATDPYPGSESTGAGEIRLMNDGKATMERRFSAPWVYPSRAVQIMLGGAFSSGQEILLNDMYRSFRGVINGDQSPRVNARQATIQIENLRTILEAKLPLRKYGIDFPDIESRDSNRPRPMVLGIKNHARSAGIDVDPTTGYRIYEAVDTTDWPSGHVGVGIDIGGSVRAYPDEEAADKMDQTRVALLEPGLDYANDTLTGLIAVLHDVRVIEINRDNNKLDFDVSGGALVATIPDGFYIIGYGGPTGANRRGLLEKVADLMTAAAGVTISATYDETTHLVTISRSAKGTLNLRWSTGLNTATGIGPTLGFDGGADDTGAVTYTGDSVLFTDPDSTHIIRADIGGYADDAAGTYTGTPGNAINLLSDMFRFVLEVFLKEPSWRYNAAEWLAARAFAPQILAAYLGGLGDQEAEMTVAGLMDRLENGSPTTGEGPVEIVLDGEGVFRISKRTTTVPDNAPHLRDHDYVEMLDGYFVPSEVNRFVDVLFDRDPSTGKPRTVRSDIELAKLLYGSDKSISFDTFLTVEADAQAANVALSALARGAIRHFKVVSKTRVLKTKKGDLIKLTADQALLGASDPGPGLAGAAFRVLTKKLNQNTHRTELVVFTNIIT